MEKKNTQWYLAVTYTGMHAVIAVIRRFCPFPYWGKGVVVDFDPTGVWAYACASVGLNYIGATSAVGKTSSISGLGNVIFNNASAAGPPHHRVHRKLFVSHVSFIYSTPILRLLSMKKVDSTCSAGCKNTDFFAGVQVLIIHR